MRMAGACVLASILASGVTTHAETDVFMRTVGFALTGSDDAAPKVIGNRAKCVFAINNDIFHLNNVHIDRLAIQGWQRQQGLEQWVTVDLHGDDIVFEDTTEPLKDDGSETIRQLLRRCAIYLRRTTTRTQNTNCICTLTIRIV